MARSNKSATPGFQKPGFFRKPGFSSTLQFFWDDPYFRTNCEGQAATEKQVGVMTELVRGIRKVVLRESQRQREPLLLAARVPVTSAFCRWIGIDIQAWLEERLIDLMAISGGYVAFDQPVDELIALGHKHDVAVYPCLSQSGLMYRPPRGNNTLGIETVAENTKLYGAELAIARTTPAPD